MLGEQAKARARTPHGTATGAKQRTKRFIEPFYTKTTSGSRLVATSQFCYNRWLLLGLEVFNG